MPDFAQRRESVRYPLCLLARPLTGAAGWQGWTENISTGGVFVQTPSAVEPGQTLQVELSFPGLLPATVVTGTVAWRRVGSAWLAAGIGLKTADQPPALDRLTRLAADANRALPGSEFRVLVVGRSLVRRPTSRGLSMTQVEDGAEALDRVGRAAPNLIFTEAFSPLTECLQTIKNLRDVCPAPIFALPSGDPDTDARVANAGVQAVLGIGIRLEPILDTVSVLRALA